MGHVDTSFGSCQFPHLKVPTHQSELRKEGLRQASQRQTSVTNEDTEIGGLTNPQEDESELAMEALEFVRRQAAVIMSDNCFDVSRLFL